MSSLATKLAIHRIAFLHPAEKRRLEAAIEGGLELSSLSLSGLEKAVGRLIRSREWRPALLSRAAESDLRFLEARGIRYIALGDPEYPPLLGEIHDPPFGLFVRGAPLANEGPALAMVGTRSATGKGLSLAVELAREAALAGIPVISGLARGIDAASHRGALAARSSDPEAGGTLAVLPVGIDSVYPPSHRGLAAAILEKGGSLVSEYPPGEGPRTWRFPERNRIIAGIARATLVIEAPADSGALITANHALDAGRDVWVARGSLGSPMNAGADRLAAEGAPALSSLDELRGDWGFSFRSGTEPGEGRRRRGGGLGCRNGDGAESLAAELRNELGLEIT